MGADQSALSTPQLQWSRQQQWLKLMREIGLSQHLNKNTIIVVGKFRAAHVGGSFASVIQNDLQGYSTAMLALDSFC